MDAFLNFTNFVQDCVADRGAAIAAHVKALIVEPDRLAASVDHDRLVIQGKYTIRVIFQERLHFLKRSRAVRKLRTANVAYVYLHLRSPPLRHPW